MERYKLLGHGVTHYSHLEIIFQLKESVMTRKGAAEGDLTHLNICVRKYNCKNVQ